MKSSTGSYNLSDNAEHNTFENVTISAQIPMGNCRRLRRQLRFHVESRERGVRRLYERASTLDVIPLVFDSMALTQPQVAELKRTMRCFVRPSGRMSFALTPLAIVLATCSASSESPL